VVVAKHAVWKERTHYWWWAPERQLGVCRGMAGDAASFDGQWLPQIKELVYIDNVYTI